MRFTATTLDDLKLELEQALNAPGEPRPVYSCTTSSMPPAASYPTAVLLNTTLNVIAYSDGSKWYRADTGAAI